MENKKWAEFTIPDSIADIDKNAFDWCKGLTSVNIPEAIDENAFKGSESLTSVNIPVPDGTTAIDENAFERCESLASVNIPFVVDEEWVHENYHGEADFTIPDGATAIDENAFWGCNDLTSINIPDSVTSIGDSAFSHCKNLAFVNISKNVTEIGELAFGSCESLTSIYIPDSVTKMGGGTFYGCGNLTSVHISKNVTKIESQTFEECYKLTSVNIPEGVTEIGELAFYGCKNLPSIDIPDSVTSIERLAFYKCDNLTSANIPDSVSYIGERAFDDCDNLNIICSEGSYAEDYAKHRFIPVKTEKREEIKSSPEETLYAEMPELPTEENLHEVQEYLKQPENAPEKAIVNIEGSKVDINANGKHTSAEIESPAVQAAFVNNVVNHGDSNIQHAVESSQRNGVYKGMLYEASKGHAYKDVLLKRAWIPENTPAEKEPETPPFVTDILESVTVDCNLEDNALRGMEGHFNVFLTDNAFSLGENSLPKDCVVWLSYDSLEDVKMQLPKAVGKEHPTIVYEKWGDKTPIDMIIQGKSAIEMIAEAAILGQGNPETIRQAAEFINDSPNAFSKLTEFMTASGHDENCIETLKYFVEDILDGKPVEPVFAPNKTLQVPLEDAKAVRRAVYSLEHGFTEKVEAVDHRSYIETNLEVDIFKTEDGKIQAEATCHDAYGKPARVDEIVWKLDDIVDKFCLGKDVGQIDTLPKVNTIKLDGGIFRNETLQITARRLIETPHLEIESDKYKKLLHNFTNASGNISDKTLHEVVEKINHEIAKSFSPYEDIKRESPVQQFTKQDPKNFCVNDQKDKEKA